MKKVLVVGGLGLIAISVITLTSLNHSPASKSDGRAEDNSGVSSLEELRHHRDPGELLGKDESRHVRIDPSSIRNEIRSSSELVASDARLIAISMEELEWMKNHYYPTQAEINSLATLDIDSLNGTNDPKLQTLFGLAAIRQGKPMASLGMLEDAASKGSVYAYEELALAEYGIANERFGKSIDGDRVLRARLEVAKILGDYKADALIKQYLPNFDDRANAAVVQLQTTEFLRQLGTHGQLQGYRTAGPDPRPNLDQWNDLKKLAQAGQSTPIETFSLEK